MLTSLKGFERRDYLILFSSNILSRNFSDSLNRSFSATKWHSYVSPGPRLGARSRHHMKPQRGDPAVSFMIIVEIICVVRGSGIRSAPLGLRCCFVRPLRPLAWADVGPSLWG